MMEDSKRFSGLLSLAITKLVRQVTLLSRQANPLRPEMTYFVSSPHATLQAGADLYEDFFHDLGFEHRRQLFFQSILVEDEALVIET